jgi:hypothetical protein
MLQAELKNILDPIFNLTNQLNSKTIPGSVFGGAHISQTVLILQEKALSFCELYQKQSIQSAEVQNAGAELVQLIKNCPELMPQRNIELAITLEKLLS